MLDGPTVGDGRRPGQRLPVYPHSLPAAFGSSAMSVNTLAVILLRSGIWNSGSSSASLMLFRSGEWYGRPAIYVEPSVGPFAAGAVDSVSLIHGALVSSVWRVRPPARSTCL
ncbi:hypothetical protein OIE71_28885 [Streptomyces sp. NBC_01725]|uniref:hypothetical protein n=1 Tax=Streptomyces sp. NBC_01725 TaxID=2975923 RepID=UPI002E295571|nr:hypothetical protein [Streptomyces sp. NBC_01725]